MPARNLTSVISILKYHLFVCTLVFWGCGTLVGNPVEEDDDTTEVDGSTKVADEIPDSPLQILTFNIADAPVDDVQSFFISIAGIDIRNDQDVWINVPMVLEQEIELLQYQNGDSVKFAEYNGISVGTYGETRLNLSPTVLPRLVLADGQIHDLTIEGGETALILTTPFSVEAGIPIDLTLDFDIHRSLKITGEGEGTAYSLQPVLRLLKHGEYGHVEGTAEEGEIVCVYPDGVQLDDSDSCENAMKSAKVKDGKYKLPYLPEGKYKVQVFDKEGKVKKPQGESDKKYDVEAVQYKDLKKKQNGADQGSSFVGKKSGGKGGRKPGKKNVDKPKAHKSKNLGPRADR